MLPIGSHVMLNREPMGELQAQIDVGSILSQKCVLTFSDLMHLKDIFYHYVFKNTKFSKIDTPY